MVKSCTIVPPPPIWHKGWRRWIVTLTTLVTCGAGGGWSQSAEPVGVSWGQLTSLGTATVLFVVPHTLGHDASSLCAPCDPLTIPAFDRWVVGPERAGISLTSTATLGVLAAATLADARFGNGTEYRAVALLEAAVWAAAASEVTKTVVRRARPVLYTAEAPRAARARNNTRGFPSGHAAVAFALATSYALHVDHPTAARVAALTGAAGVASLRVAARRHFPSDVIAGAALGITGALVVYEIRF